MTTPQDHLEKIWQQFAPFPRRGPVVPLFSLRSSLSVGLGEILDLLPLMHWMKKRGYNLLQLLPINEIGMGSSPYSIISSLALNPLYLSLYALPGVNLEEIFTLQRDVEGKKIDWSLVFSLKKKFLKSWLEKTFQGKLPENIAVFGSRFLELKKHVEFLAPQKGFTADEYLILQYYLFKQMGHVKEVADSLDIKILGDLPILFDEASADCFYHPEWFNFSYVAGAPPDIYAREGQKWGFPLFNWEAISKDNFLIWKERFAYAEHFYHGYRLDHVIGFFRIWAIPKEAPAIEGFYSPGTEEEAEKAGKHHLEEIIPLTTMLPLAEDLGVILPFMREILSTMRIPGMKIVPWERDWDATKQFIPLEQYPFYSATMLSTHDSETISSWWHNHPAEAELLADSLEMSYNPDLCLKTLIEKTSTSNSALHFFMLHDLFQMEYEEEEDSRVNVPGITSEHNWSCRIRNPVDFLL